MCPERSNVTCDIGIVSQAGNWKYFDFEEPESVKIKHIHTAKNKVYVLIAWSLCPDMFNIVWTSSKFG